MSATEILDQIHRLTPTEQYEIAGKILEEFGNFDDELTSEQIAELDRRAEVALKTPGRGKPVEQVFGEIEERLLAKK